MVKPVIFSALIFSTMLFIGCASQPTPRPSAQVKTFPVAPEFYTIKTGESLSQISQRYGLDYQSVANLNKISNPNLVKPHQRIRLRGAAYATQSVAMPEVKPNSIPNTTTVSNIPIIAGTQLRWQRPSQGRVTASFDPNQNRKGVQFTGNLGDPVFAASNGEVVYVGVGLPEYGQLILIRHPQGYITAYAFNQRMLVKVGDVVQAGQKIAEMGQILEFQIRLNGKPMNPASFMAL